jgi:hypothetical protein
MTGSLPFNPDKGCPSGYHKRKSYTSKLGHRVEPRCVKSTTVYSESRANFTRRSVQRQSARLRAVGKSAVRKSLKCPPGQLQRRGYVRKFATTVRRKGYTVRKASGKVYRIFPEKESVYVKPSCVTDRGLPGKLGSGEGFSILRKGELKKHGYIYNTTSEIRREALKKAEKEFGALGVFRKLDAIAKLSKNTIPEASRIFKLDRDWIKTHYELKAPA